MKATIVLEDGSVFEGESIGATGERIGEVIINTAVVGYQEILTDPSNAGKIIVFTYPLIGNYGVAKKFYESKKAWPEALIIKEKSKIYSNWQAKSSFDEFIKKENLMGAGEVDTRTLAITIRDKGHMLGIISTKETNPSSLLKKLGSRKKDIKNDFIRKTSVKKITKMKGNQSGPRIAVLDLGVLNSFLRQLALLGCNVTMLPFDTDENTILKLNAAGLIISNGPEDDEAIKGIVNVARKILGKIPILGISTGHEIIALALGGRLKKMKLGHRGVNYPVKSESSLKGGITVQNHEFIVDEESLNKKDAAITLRNVNDNSIEEMESQNLKFISVQYYPASPGFDEINDVFKRFLKMASGKEAKRNLICQSAQT